jgi:thioredoxin-like negative regulator of GroEL
MLDGLARDGGGSPQLAQTASATLLRLLVEDGRMDEAERRLGELGSSLAVDDRAALSRRIALGWARRGELKRADALAANDSSVDGMALRGHLLLLRGDVAGAVEQLRSAGPFAGTRQAATERTRMLAILSPIDADTLPRLGEAFLALERGDSSQAVTLLAQVGAELPRSKGGSELSLLAGQLAAAHGDAASAERLLRAASDTAAPATAPQALLALGRLLGQSGRGNEATAVLEQLILTYPRSALVPQARRALDEAKGAVPN